MIKTISRNEFLFMKKILKYYFLHIMGNKHTLISRIYGLHQMRIYKNKTKIQKVYLTVIGNIFQTPLEIDVRYDIKGKIIVQFNQQGSFYGRKTRLHPGMIVDKNVALKDLDFLEDKNKLKLSKVKQQLSKINVLDQDEKKLLIDQIYKDSVFFEQNQVIDYSLLIGIHKLSSSQQRAYSINMNQLRNNNQKVDLNLLNEENSRFYERYEGGMLSADRKCVYFIGIIDILTFYNTRKKMEYSVKSTFIDQTVSCIPPSQYARRFKEFVTKECIE